MADGEGQGVFFADVAAAIVDEGQAVGVGIDGESDGRLVSNDGVAEAAQVLFDVMGIDTKVSGGVGHQLCKSDCACW